MSDEAPAAIIPPTLPPSSLAGSSPVRPASRLRWGIHLAIMAALPVLAGLGGGVAGRTGPALTHSAHGLLMVCALDLAVVGLIFGVAWRISRATGDDLLLRWQPRYWVLPLGAVYSLAIRLVAGIVVAIGMGLVLAATRTSVADVQHFAEVNRPKVETLVDVHAMSHNPAYFWLNVILVSLIVGGLREELWRSSFLAGLRSLWPRIFGSPAGGILGAGVAALFFGAGHLPQGWLAVAMITIVGFLLGVIMALHRSVWPSVVAHGLFDAASLALLPWLVQHMDAFRSLQHAGG